jgi:hypothetical protein
MVAATAETLAELSLKETWSLSLSVQYKLYFLKLFYVKIFICSGGQNQSLYFKAFIFWEQVKVLLGCENL